MIPSKSSVPARDQASSPSATRLHDVAGLSQMGADLSGDLSFVFNHERAHQWGLIDVTLLLPASTLTSR